MRERVTKVKKLTVEVCKYVFGRLGMGVTSYVNLINLQKQASAATSYHQDLEFVRTFIPTDYEWLISSLHKSRSQLRQDLFVLSEYECKRGGYFVEFGATNGIDLSNTYLLETEFSWIGILAEPAKVWQRKLKANRPNASIENMCIWKNSNTNLTFNETVVAELSTIESFSDKDLHKVTRQRGKNYNVQTISLNDLLIKHHAPKRIDYLSIDTEGSEYEILKAFNFDIFSIGIITVEHNYTPQRELIFDLLTSHGYKRKYENISAFDDWYVKI